MWYRDLDGTDKDNVRAIGEFFDCSEYAATMIYAAARSAFARGDQGLPFSDTINGSDDYRDLRKIEASLNPTNAYGGVDCSDLAQLFHDAWKEGIQRKDRVTVQLDSQSCDSCCTECGRSLSNGAEECEHCGSTEIDHSVSVTVLDPFAELWADDDKYIDGSTWESAGDGCIYTILSARKGLADELASEGYRLDLSCYCEDE
jgi:hypothetical protein